MKPHPLIVIGGPTASGKSAWALRVCEAVDGEIVSADSVQVYRGFDIGAAKPSAEDQAKVPHHLIDILDPTERYSAADFVTHADRAIEKIRAAGRVPVVVGGTGLYLRSLLSGLAAAPPADMEVRARLEARAEAEGKQALWAALSAVDSVTADRLHPNDVRRVVRALEVFEVSGQPLSEHHAAHGLRDDRHPHTLWATEIPRARLRALVQHRAAEMLGGGLIAEVDGLLTDGVPETAPAFEALGYRHVLEWRRGDLEFDALLPAIQRDHWNFAKRQLTWFRGQHKARWFDPIRTDLDAFVAASAASGPVG